MFYYCRLKDGKILTTSKKYEVLNPREDLHSLIVHDVNKDDSGRYVCWARNEFGEAFTEAYLNIIREYGHLSGVLAGEAEPV